MPYVADISNDTIALLDADSGLDNALRSHGPVRESALKIRIRSSSPGELPRLLGQLRDLGVAILGGSGWAPAEQFADYRERGLVQGQFVELVFVGPGQARMRAR